jgi:hypothetical protein
VIDLTLTAGRRLVLPLICLGLAGCGSSQPGQQSSMRTLGNIVMFQSATPPVADQLPKDPESQEEPLVCPEVIITDGGAALRAQSGEDSGGLRYQISITDVARQCTATGTGGFRLKVGVQGRVLLGPAGRPGNFGATLTTSVTRGKSVVGRRSARVGGTIPAGQAGVDFTHVEDGIMVPAGTGDVEIFVGLGGGGPAAPARQRRR